jgi:hypothetical protein
MVQCERDLGNVEHDSGLGESPLLVHVVKQLTPCEVVQNKVNPELSLKDKLHLHNKGVAHLQQYQLFKVDTGHTVVIHYHVLAHRL